MNKLITGILAATVVVNSLAAHPGPHATQETGSVAAHLAFFHVLPPLAGIALLWVAYLRLGRRALRK